MRRVIAILSLLTLLLVAVGIVYFGGSLYYVGGRVSPAPFIMQTDNLARDRVTNPIAMDEIPANQIRLMLIKKFMHEYFDVRPYPDDMVARLGELGALQYIANGSVYEKWSRAVAPEISKMASAKQMRAVRVHENIETRGEYLRVVYDLITWENPNRYDVPTTVQRGNETYIKVWFEDGLLESDGRPLDIGKYIAAGLDPAALFKFRVLDMQ